MVALIEDYIVTMAAGYYLFLVFYKGLCETILTGGFYSGKVIANSRQKVGMLFYSFLRLFSFGGIGWP